MQYRTTYQLFEIALSAASRLDRANPGVARRLLFASEDGNGNNRLRSMLRLRIGENDGKSRERLYGVYSNNAGETLSTAHDRLPQAYELAHALRAVLTTNSSFFHWLSSESRFPVSTDAKPH